MRDAMVDGVRVITLQREPMNTLDLDAVQTLARFFGSHPQRTPLVLEGSENVFSAGVDAKRFTAYPPSMKLDMARAITQMTSYLLAITAPVVASISGHALGGGLVLALCCDYRLATDDPKAKFGLLEAKAGIAFPSGPALIVQAELPPPLLRQLTLSCRNVSAGELLDHAIFDELAQPDRLKQLAITRAQELAALPGFDAVKAQMRGRLAADVRQAALDAREHAFESLA